MLKAASESRGKNLMLGGAALLLLVGAVLFGFRESLFRTNAVTDNGESTANNDEVTNRITGGQPATVEPDPEGPKPEPGSGRRAIRPQ